MWNKKICSLDNIYIVSYKINQIEILFLKKKVETNVKKI